METGHFIEKCSCGEIIRQCRCMDKNKKIITIVDGCEKCKEKLNKEKEKVNAMLRV